jgi:hypothetical protein
MMLEQTISRTEAARLEAFQKAPKLEDLKVIILLMEHVHLVTFLASAHFPAHFLWPTLMPRLRDLYWISSWVKCGILRLTDVSNARPPARQYPNGTLMSIALLSQHWPHLQ